MKKKLISTLLLVSLVGATPIMAAASESVPDPATPTVTASEPVKATRADEFMHYYRTYNGIEQYRIWNITKGCWVIPWTNCV